jgi:hypothetical protein
MKAATRLLAMIATGGVVIGGGAALWQLPEPKTANTASTASTGASDAQAVQQLVQEGTQLHAAVEAARLQIASLDAAASGPTPSGDDKAAVAAQAQQLAQAKAALAATGQQLAADEALIARLEHRPPPRTVAAPSATTASSAAHSSRTATTGVPSIGDDPTTAPVPTVTTHSPTPRPSRTRSASPTSSPTNGRSDD